MYPHLIMGVLAQVENGDKELLQSDNAALQLLVFYLFPMCSYQVLKCLPQVFLKIKFPIAP
jgi:hypothetical protein